MATERPEWLTLKQAGLRFGLSGVHLRGLIYDGRLKAELRGRDWFVTPGAVRAYLASRKPAGRPSATRKGKG